MQVEIWYLLVECSTTLTISPLFVLLARRKNLLGIDTNLGYVAVCGGSNLCMLTLQAIHALRLHARVDTDAHNHIRIHVLVHDMYVIESIIFERVFDMHRVSCIQACSDDAASAGGNGNADGRIQLQATVSSAGEELFIAVILWADVVKTSSDWRQKRNTIRLLVAVQPLRTPLASPSAERIGLTFETWAEGCQDYAPACAINFVTLPTVW